MTNIQRVLIAFALLAMPALGASAQERVTHIGSRPTQPARPDFPRIYTENPQVAFVLMPSLPNGARAVVLRRAATGDLPGNFILVTQETSPADVVAALSALATSRLRRGEVVPAGRNIGSNIRTSSAEAAAQSKNYGLAVRYLAGVRQASPRTIDGLGSHPTVVMSLPPIPASMRQK